MKHFWFSSLMVLSTILMIPTSFSAEPFAGPDALYSEGKQYLDDFPQAKSSKPIVYEFFSFGCAHCFSKETTINQWLSTKPDNIIFKKIPVVNFQPDWNILARAYYISKALKIEESFGKAFFNEIHMKKNRPKTLAQLKKIFMSQGVKAEDFDKNAKSFYVESSMKKSYSLQRKFKVGNVPDFVINKRYRVGKQYKNEDERIEIINAVALKDFK